MISGVIEILKDDSDLCAAVGRNVADTKAKFFWVVCGEKENPPYVILRRSALTPEHIKDRPSLVDGQQFETYTYAKVTEQAEVIDEKMRLLLENGGHGWNAEESGFIFQRIFIVDKSDGFDKDAGFPFIRSAYVAQYRRKVVT